VTGPVAAAVDIRRLGTADRDAVVAASHLFDRPADPDATRRFLESPDHHLLVAYEGGPIGFVTGIETTHPDKGTEMFLYELTVDERGRGRGVGTALVLALRELARERGCYAMWVLTDEDNDAALRTYGAAGAAPPTTHLMFEWRLAADT
jgi:ribosomal protein S18 acetylase RimI-like enzyme